ncbi:hypothetical protein LZ30DRAFT_741887 [Colletotrichum cereale]|nr:hypothetical protein LZ30DRAFT_741887 [Colletotrichum cereale]
MDSACLGFAPAWLVLLTYSLVKCTSLDPPGDAARKTRLRMLLRQPPTPSVPIPSHPHSTADAQLCHVSNWMTGVDRQACICWLLWSCSSTRTCPMNRGRLRKAASKGALVEELEMTLRIRCPKRGKPLVPNC